MKLEGLKIEIHRRSTWLVCVHAVLSTFFAELFNRSGIFNFEPSADMSLCAGPPSNDTRIVAPRLVSFGVA